jgi:hypothetical protein
VTQVVRGRAFGRTFEVRVPDGLDDGIEESLPWSWRPAEEMPERVWALEQSDDTYRAVADGEVIGQWHDATRALHFLLADLELWVAEHARRRVFIHAGCVVFEGRAIVLPGRTLAGKSTLTAALVRAGCTYYSDEYAVIGADGHVRPYARLLALRPPEGGLGVRTPVASLGGAAGRRPVPIGMVALLQYDAVIGFAAEPLTRAQTALGLLDNAVPARTRPRAVMNALERATANATGFRGTRGDADEAAEHLIGMLHR